MALTRRTWIKGVAACLGLGAVAGGVVWRRFGVPELADLSDWSGFSREDVALLDEIAEAIIPATDTPGAKASGVGAFIALAVAECYEPAQRAAFVFGLRKLEASCLDRYGHGFRQASSEQRLELLVQIDQERRLRELWNRGQRGLRLLGRPLFGLGPPLVQVPHFLTMVGELTVLGYFTSEPGATQALRHMAIPGEFNGALPYRKGDRAWSM
jgi:hypothetical protein